MTAKQSASGYISGHVSGHVFGRTSATAITLLSALAFVLLVHPSRANASESHSFCQVKLLKAATDGLVQEFANKARYVGDIRQITYNYGLPGKPRVIFIANHVFNDDETCILDVRTEAADEGGDTCPNYKFTEVRTTCNPPSKN
jgi:hypothetical protein